MKLAEHFPKQNVVLRDGDRVIGIESFVEG